MSSSRSYFRLRHPGKSEFVEIDTDMFQDAQAAAPSPAFKSIKSSSLWSAAEHPHCIVPKEEIQQQLATLRRVVSMKESQWSNSNARRAAEDTKENRVMNRDAVSSLKGKAAKMGRAALNPCHHNNPFLPSATAAAEKRPSAPGECVQGRHSSYNPTEERLMRVPEFIRNGSVVVSRTYSMHEGEAASLECGTCGRGLGVVMNGVHLDEGCIKLCQVCNAPPPPATTAAVTNKMPKRGNAFVRSFRRILHF